MNIEKIIEEAKVAREKVLFLIRKCKVDATLSGLTNTKKEIEETTVAKLLPGAFSSEDMHEK